MKTTPALDARWLVMGDIRRGAVAHLIGTLQYR
jgi:cobyric acid synthase